MPQQHPPDERQTTEPAGEERHGTTDDETLAAEAEQLRALVDQLAPRSIAGRLARRFAAGEPPFRTNE